VQTNNDLDIPTQQELLAQYRCDQIFTGTLTEFNNRVESQRRHIEAGKVINGLGEMMRTWRSEALCA
jgi:hypothetical protein